MGPFWALLKNSFLSLLLTTSGGGRRKKSGRRSVSGLGALLLICIIFLYISGTYSFAMASTLGPAGGLDIMLAIMAVMATFFPLAFTLYSAQGTIFSTKDMDLVLSLPVSPMTVMLSRVMALYLEILLMAEMILIPAGVAYLMTGGSGGAAVMVMLLLEGIVLAFLPTLLTMVFGYLIGFLVSRMRFKNLFSILFSIILVVVLMVVAFAFNSGVESIATDIDGVREMLFSALPPLKWAVLGMTGLQLRYLLLLILICVIPFFVVAWLFSLHYKRLLTNLTGHRISSNYRIGEVGASGSMSALFRKEVRRFFGTPAYFMNSGVGCILLVIALLVALVQRDTIQEMIALFGTDPATVQVVQSYLPGVFLGILIFFILTTAPSAVSVSLEGKNLWILKEAPLGPRQIFAAKAGFNFVLAGGLSIVGSVIGGIVLGVSPVAIVCILIICLLYSAFVSMTGLLINLAMPRLDADNDTIVIKQSGSVLVGMLINFGLAAVLVVVFLVMSVSGAGFPLFTLVAGIILVALNALIAFLLNTKGRRLFAELY